MNRSSFLGAIALLLSGCPIDSDTDYGRNLVEPETIEKPPPRPRDAPAGEGSETVLIINRYYLESSPSDNRFIDPWEELGYDRDNMITVSDFDEHCLPAGGASPTNIFPDGLGGIDNSFGRIVMPMMAWLFGTGEAGNVEASANAGLHGSARPAAAPDNRRARLPRFKDSPADHQHGRERGPGAG